MIKRVRRLAGRLVIVLATLAVTGSFSAVQAHHSFAMFDTSKTLSVVGTVKDYQWKNPHVWVDMQVKQGNRQTSVSIEGASVNILGRSGWSRNTLKAGDKVTVFFHPLKTQKSGGSLVKVVLADGRELVVER